MIFYRFSLDGFVPKRQKKWRELRDLMTSEPPAYPNEWQKKLVAEAIMKDRRKVKQLALSDFKYGIHAFVGKPDAETQRLFLNHLSPRQAKMRRWYHCEMPDTIEIYSDDDVVPMKYAVGDFLESHGVGAPCYIPARELSRPILSPQRF